MSVLDMTLNLMIGSNYAGALENVEYFFTPSLPGPLSIVWNRTDYLYKNEFGVK